MKNLHHIYSIKIFDNCYLNICFYYNKFFKFKKSLIIIILKNKRIKVIYNKSKEG